MVDDSQLNLKIGVLQLRERGMLVDTASNGQIAVDILREKGTDAYDYVLMDVQMPVMDGYEATSHIRKLPGGDKLTIIAFSANAFGCIITNSPCIMPGIFTTSSCGRYFRYHFRSRNREPHSSVPTQNCRTVSSFGAGCGTA